MIRRLRRHPILLTVLTAGCLLLGGLVWLLGTSTGASWTLAAISRWSSLNVGARQVEGSLAGILRLQGMTVAWPHGSAEIEALRLDWRPLALLGGSVSIGELSARGMTVEEQAREGTVSSLRLSWPSPSGPVAWLRGEVDALRVENLEVRSGGKAPIGIDHLEAKLAWQNGALKVVDLGVVTPEAVLQGTVTAGFASPSLAGKLDLELHPPGESPRRLSLSVDLTRASRGELLAGPLAATLEPLSATISRLRLDARLTVRETAVLVKSFQLAAPGRPGVVSGGGALNLAGGEPSLRLQAKVENLDLEPATGVPTDLEGTLDFSGDRRHYQGSVSLFNRGVGWKKLRLSGPFSGDAGSLAFSELEGQWIRGLAGRPTPRLLGGGDFPAGLPAGQGARSRKGGFRLARAGQFRPSGKLPGRKRALPRRYPRWEAA